MKEVRNDQFEKVQKSDAALQDQSQGKANFQAKQGAGKFEKSEKSKKARKKKEESEKKARATRSQYSDLKDKYDSSKKEERPKSQPTKAKPQSNHLL